MTRVRVYNHVGRARDARGDRVPLAEALRAGRLSPGEEVVVGSRVVVKMGSDYVVLDPSRHNPYITSSTTLKGAVEEAARR